MRIMVVMLAAWLTGCATSGPDTENMRTGPEHVENAHVVDSAAHDEENEICLKSEAFAIEMCYGRGQARLDPQTGQIIGYEMRLTRIEANSR